MKGPAFLRGLFPIGRHEFLVNLKSIRMLIMIVVLALIVVGGAYGIGRGTGGGGGGGGSSFNIWPHPAIGSSGQNVTVVWVSDPFGAPLPDTTVVFSDNSQPTEQRLGTVSADADGFARFETGDHTRIFVRARVGNSEVGTSVFFDQEIGNFTVQRNQNELDNDGRYNDLGIHVLTRAGQPAAARLYLNSTYVKTVDARGYGRLELPPGESNVTVEVAGENETQGAYAFERIQTPAFSSGPDFVLLIIASVFATFVIPLFATVITFDAVSKERVQGTIDLLLSRPTSRIGALLGKFLGIFLAIALPVIFVNLVGIGVLTAVSGRAPTGSFVLAFLSLSLLLIAFYMPVQLIFSTFAKTSGTAILFGILVWLAFNVLYPVITLVLASTIFPNNFEAQFRLTQYAALGNPSSIYQQLVAFSAPESVRFSFGSGSILSLPVVATAAVVWFVATLALALWTFHRKAAE
ncbi:MAG TPA: ABC transporter permease subunit [Thermoplasmata archaeon]|nr:ABC transporter permease subunit [Thermoplasmata archaeon]